jgi:hypothetical protein
MGHAKLSKLYEKGVIQRMIVVIEISGVQTLNLDPSFKLYRLLINLSWH